MWDASTVASLDAITTKYEARGTEVTITGLNPDSRRHHEKLAGSLSGGH